MYLLAAVLGLLGAGSLLRGVERIIFTANDPTSPGIQLVTGAVFLALAHKSWMKARASARPEPSQAPRG